MKDKKILKTLIFSTIIIILSVLFFEIPLLEQKSSADYEVFRYGKMYSRGSVFIHALHPWQLISSNIPGIDNTMYFCIGLPILMCLITYVFVRKHIPEKYKSF